MKRISLLLHTFIALYLMMVFAVYAAPKLISYQGVLNDSSGSPVSSIVIMTFNIYDVPSGGTILWTESQRVQVSNGIFNVKLGSVQQLPDSVFLRDTLYLGIQVASDPEMVPRQQIIKQAYVHSPIPIGTIMPWAKSLPGVPDLPDGWVECNGQVLDDPESLLNGQTIPDLNGQNRFLRGNSTSGGTGGAETKSATTSQGNGNVECVQQGCCSYVAKNEHNHSVSLNVLPPYYNVTWVIRVK